MHQLPWQLDLRLGHCLYLSCFFLSEKVSWCEDCLIMTTSTWLSVWKRSLDKISFLFTRKKKKEERKMRNTGALKINRSFSTSSVLKSKRLLPCLAVLVSRREANNACQTWLWKDTSFFWVVPLSFHCTGLSYFKFVMKGKILKLVIMRLPCIKTHLVFIISNLYYTRALTHTFQDRLGIACCIYITLKSLSRYTK